MAPTAERRAKARFNTSCAARMRVLRPTTTNLTDVTIINASRSGVRVAVPESLQPRSIVQITFDKSILIAEVRNCVAAGDGYTAGLFVSIFCDRDDPDTHTGGARVRDIVRHPGADPPLVC